jgi:flagellar basal-body rod protein FlgB
MDPGDIAIFDLADKRLAWIDRRQQLLAQNIANADTPDWQAKDLKPFAATLSGLSAEDLTLTNPLHLAGTEGGSNAPDRKALPEQRAPDGNAVALDSELTKVAQTNDTHALVINLYQTYLAMFRTAIGR